MLLVTKKNPVMALREKVVKGDYEKFMTDSFDKRAEESESMIDKEVVLALF